MKFLLCLATALLFITPLAQAQSPGVVITKPDLLGRVQQSGTNLIITVDNGAIPNPNNASGKASRSVAKLTLNGQSQNIQVPEIAPDGKFTHQVAIPAGLRSKAFDATLKVDNANSIPESNENNNTFTATLNAPDLTPVLVNGHVKFREDATSYYMSVKNEGIVKSPAFALRVTYQLRNGQTKVVQGLSTELPVGGTTEVKVPAPPADCFNQDCLFKVEIDPANNIKEVRENNNTSNGKRIG